jgi:HAD superfamily hydrolase (TIGR01509 family)
MSFAALRMSEGGTIILCPRRTPTEHVGIMGDHLEPSKADLGTVRSHRRVAAILARLPDGTSMTNERWVSIPVRALAFDVDGTIADTDPIHAEAWARALQSVNGRQFELVDYLDACINGAMTPQQFISSFSSQAEWSLIETEKRRIYPTLLSERATLTAGLVELLAAAHSARIGLAIVSSSSRESVEALLAGPWESAPPNVIVARGDASAPKPDPAPYRTAVEQLGVPGGLVVAFEDSESGASSAKSAGLTCIQVGLVAKALSELRVTDFRDCSIVHDDESPCLIVRSR